MIFVLKLFKIFFEALNLNHLHPGTWFVYGICRLVGEEFKEAARGFRRCVQLEYDNFEAWANLSNAELKAGNRDAALRTLLESIKCNFEKWELWFNLVTIATDLGDFNSSIRAYTKLMELKPEKDYTDEPVLAVLQQAINDNVEDYQGNKARKHLHSALDLFQKVVQNKPSFIAAWRLYAKLVVVQFEPDAPIRRNVGKMQVNIATVLQKALRAMLSEGDWWQVAEKLGVIQFTVDHLCRLGIRCFNF